MRRGCFVMTCLLLALQGQAHESPHHKLDELNEFLASHPEDIEHLLVKADLLVRVKQLVEAEAVIEQVETLAPEHPESACLRIRIAQQRKEFAGALALAEKTAIRHPECEEVWCLLGEVRLQAGNARGTIEAWKKSLSCPVAHPPGDYIRLARLLAEQGTREDLEQALNILEKGLHDYKGLKKMRYMAIDANVALNRTKAALKHVNALVARYRPQIPFALKRAEILESAGRYAEAAHAVDQAVALLHAMSPAQRNSVQFNLRRKELIHRRNHYLSLQPLTPNVDNH